jgi:hypothetical protein
MATFSEQTDQIYTAYEDDGQPTPASAREVAAWAIKRGLLKPPPADIVDICAEMLSRGWREVYRTDRQGRRYRAKHAVRMLRGGVQLTLWADIETAPRSHMEMAFAQRRQQVVGDCIQLKRDVDAYNDAHADDAKLQLILDFTYDVEEAEMGRDAA